MPGGNYEAGNVSYGIPYSEWRDCAREFMKIKCPETTALSAPCPASYCTPSPHLICCFAPYTLRHPTSALPLSLYIATSTSTSTNSIPPICTAADQYRMRVPFFTVLYWPRPASSAPALFILVATNQSQSPSVLFSLRVQYRTRTVP